MYTLVGLVGPTTGPTRPAARRGEADAPNDVPAVTVGLRRLPSTSRVGSAARSGGVRLAAPSTGRSRPQTRTRATVSPYSVSPTGSKPARRKKASGPPTPGS